MLTQPDKITAVIGGQFGSEGKGVIQGWLGNRYSWDYAITNASANAGHTCHFPFGPDKKVYKLITYHLPMSGLLDVGCKLHLSAGAIIDPRALESEIDAIESAWPMPLGIRRRLTIDPRAAVIEPKDIATELDPESGAAKIASTQHGVGAALVRKIQRTAYLAQDYPSLVRYVYKPNIALAVRNGAQAILEIPQGFGLGINSGYSYPHCTSREVSVAQGMADARLDPRLLGSVVMVVRTFPIRVGNIATGESGPFYPDSREVTWEKIGVPAEITTVTKRIRRVATFSQMQYAEALAQLQPSHVHLSFADYLSPEGLAALALRMGESGHAPDTMGFGPSISDVRD